MKKERDDSKCKFVRFYKTINTPTQKIVFGEKINLARAIDKLFNRSKCDFFVLFGKKEQFSG